MGRSAAKQVPVSRWVRQSRLVPVSALRPAPGLRFTRLQARHRPSGIEAEAVRHASAAGPRAVTADIGNIALSLRLGGAFATVSFIALAGAFATNLAISEPYGANTEQARPAQLVAFGFAALTALVSAALGLSVARSIARPVSAITATMEALSSGQLDAQMPDTGRADEIGRMGRAIAVFKDNALKMQAMTAEREAERRKEFAEREALRAHLAARLRESVGDQVDAVQVQIDTLRTLSAQMLETQKSAIERAGQMDGASTRGLELANNFASAIAQLKEATTQIAGRVEETAALSAEANDRARQTETDIEALLRSADSVTRVVDLINAIAGKTKILALNAQVEAVRAGRAGAAFNIVAEEVKSLSQQTSEAVAEVEAQIGQIRTQSGATADQVRAVIAIIGRIDTSAHEISGAVQAQLEAAATIAGDAEQSRDQNTRMKTASGALVTGAGETEAAALRVEESARSVDDSIARLQSEFAAFLDDSPASEDAPQESAAALASAGAGTRPIVLERH